MCQWEDGRKFSNCHLHIADWFGDWLASTGSAMISSQITLERKTVSSQTILRTHWLVAGQGTALPSGSEQNARAEATSYPSAVSFFLSGGRRTDKFVTNVE